MLPLGRFGLVACALLTAARSAAAQDTAPEPPPVIARYVQYGVAVGGETVVTAADVCPAGGQGQAPCILRSGAGLSVRVGYRARGPWYFGGAYEFSRQDSANLLRLPILQQLRAELRYYPMYGTRTVPYVALGAGAVVYGNEWGVDTAGAVASLGIGGEFQVSRTSLIGGALSYRPMLLRAWTDSSGQRRADAFLQFGMAHLVALEITLELREPLSRW